MTDKRKVVLLTDNSEDSQKAREILRRNDIPFEVSPARDWADRLPAVMDGTAMYRGLENIRRMVNMPTQSQQEKK